MSRTNSVSLLQHAFARFVAGAGAIALTVGLLAASDARAADLQTVRISETISVQYSAEELESTKGAESVYRKLKKAARSACGIDGGFLNLHEKTVAKQCVKDTLAEAVSKINRPMLSSLHDSSGTQSG